MSSLDGFTTSHWQTSGPLVLELYVGIIALIRNLRGSSMCVAYFLTYYPWVFAQTGMRDVRSGGAVIKCLYCILNVSGKR